MTSKFGQAIDGLFLVNSRYKQSRDCQLLHIYCVRWCAVSDCCFRVDLFRPDFLFRQIFCSILNRLQSNFCMHNQMVMMLEGLVYLDVHIWFSRFTAR